MEYFEVLDLYNLFSSQFTGRDDEGVFRDNFKTMSTKTTLLVIHLLHCCLFYKLSNLNDENEDCCTLMSYCLDVAEDPKLKVALAHEPLEVSMYTVTNKHIRLSY